MPKTTSSPERREWLRCSCAPGYFLDRYGWLYDATARGWVQWRLWPAQQRALATLHTHRLVVVLKARQLGLSWLAVGYALWLMLFRPAATVLFFSRRDEEAVDLLDYRLKGLYRRLPDWQRCREMAADNAHVVRLSNGSAALAFPTTGGRSYTATLAVVDEADFCPDLDGLLNAVKPTIDAGGRLVLLSTADKSRPESAFKRIFRGAQRGENSYRALFLPWPARPGRTAQWYAEQSRDVLARTGSLDDLYQEYPASELEALAARSLDRRFAAEWLARCDELQAGKCTVCTGNCTACVRRFEGSKVGSADLPPRECETGNPPTCNLLTCNLLTCTPPALPGLTVFAAPAPGVEYLIGADPAEGNPQSDESAASVIEAQTGAQVAVLAGRLDPALFAGQLARLSEWYNGAPLLV